MQNRNTFADLGTSIVTVSNVHPITYNVGKTTKYISIVKNMSEYWINHAENDKCEHCQRHISKAIREAREKSN